MKTKTWLKGSIVNIILSSIVAAIAYFALNDATFAQWGTLFTFILVLIYLEVITK